MTNTPTIADINEAIAMFDGGIWKEDDYGDFGFFFPNRRPHSKEALKYHSSYDWLMPVVEKISKIPLLHWDNRKCAAPQDVCYPITFGMPTEDGTQVMVRFNGFSLHVAPTLIEAAHMAVYEVAEYHNKQQNESNP